MVRRLGTDGWLGIGWPKEYGGAGLSPWSSSSSSRRRRAPGCRFPGHSQTVGPTIAERGTDEQKQQFLPGILSGEIHFAIGYREPGAGTDLASLRTRAVRDGDEYVVNGQKIWTTGAHHAD